MTAGDWIALGGDLLVTAGLVVTLIVYLLQRATSAELLRRSALAILHGAKNGIDPWGQLHFTTDYSGRIGQERAIQDYDAVMQHGYVQNFRVPAEPLAIVLQQRDEGRFIARATIETVSLALWRIGQFNQLVEQQTQFNAQHAADIAGSEISETRRLAIAEAARRISLQIHQQAIGDSSWYAGLMDALDRNIIGLGEIGRRRWWQLSEPALPGL